MSSMEFGPNLRLRKRKPMEMSPHLENKSVISPACRVRNEFLEMPWLSLTPAQAQRLWNLDALTCRSILLALIDEKFLTWTANGRLVRSDGAATVRSASES
jgi:hypothetical protein